MEKNTNNYNSINWDINSRILIESKLSKRHRQLLLKKSKFTKFVNHESKILDIGCGSGAFLTHFSSQGYSHLFGVEHDQSLIDFIPSGIANIKVGIAENIPFEDNSFDAVFIYGVLHHLKTDSETYRMACDEIVRVLKPGGHIFIMEPGRYYVFILMELIAKFLSFFSKTFNSFYKTMLEEKKEQHYFLKNHGFFRTFFEERNYKTLVDQYFLYSWIYVIQK